MRAWISLFIASVFVGLQVARLRRKLATLTAETQRKKAPVLPAASVGADSAVKAKQTVLSRRTLVACWEYTSNTVTTDNGEFP